jgi:hypothetical protein
MKHIKWLILSMLIFVVTALPIFAVAGYYNYKIDPLWNFGHAHAYNDFQNGFDERQQKTNMITHTPFDYEGLLIGTSRVTYMDQKKFTPYKTFNYAVSAMAVREYKPFIEYAKKRNGKDFKVIYMELYFGSFDKYVKLSANEPEFYFNKTNEFLYPYKTLFSYNTLKRSRFNKKISIENNYNRPRYYNRGNVGLTNIKDGNIQAKMKRFEATFNKTKKKGTYPYNPDYKKMLQSLKKANPNTKFIIFTEPIYYERFKMTLKNPNYYAAYERWYKDMADVFGEIYSFQGKNSVNLNEKNFIDLYHYFPNVGTSMAHRMSGIESGIPSDFGVKVTKNNVNDYLDSIKRDLTK